MASSFPYILNGPAVIEELCQMLIKGPLLLS